MGVNKEILELLRTHGVAKYKEGDCEIVFFPDAPEMKIIQDVVKDVAQPSGCPACGKANQRFSLMGSICDNCVKREAGVR